MPSQYYIPPSLSSIVWADGQNPNDTTNYKKYLYNDDGNLIWKSPTSFSMDQFAADMRVRYVFWASTTYTNLSGSTFTQIKDSTTNARHAIAFSNVSYVTNATAPLGALLIGTTGHPNVRIPTTVLPSSASTKYFACFVLNLSLNTNSSIWFTPNQGYNYVRIGGDGAGADGRMSNNTSQNFSTNFTALSPYTYKTKFCIFIIENTGTNTKLWMNGNDVGGDAVAQVFGFGANDITLFNIGYDTPGTDWALKNALIDEFFVIQGESCTTLNRQKIEGLYGWRHRFETYLATNHPYQNSSP